jgi:hypothetical protein
MTYEQKKETVRVLCMEMLEEIRQQNPGGAAAVTYIISESPLITLRVAPPLDPEIVEFPK